MQNLAEIVSYKAGKSATLKSGVWRQGRQKRERNRVSGMAFLNLFGPFVPFKGGFHFCTKLVDFTRIGDINILNTATIPVLVASSKLTSEKHPKLHFFATSCIYFYFILFRVWNVTEIQIHIDG